MTVRLPAERATRWSPARPCLCKPLGANLPGPCNRLSSQSVLESRKERLLSPDRRRQGTGRGSATLLGGAHRKAAQIPPLSRSRAAAGHAFRGDSAGHLLALLGHRPRLLIREGRRRCRNRDACRARVRPTWSPVRTAGRPTPTAPSRSPPPSPAPAWFQSTASPGQTSAGPEQRARVPTRDPEQRHVAAARTERHGHHATHQQQPPRSFPSFPAGHT
jgi:hypothetical protein